MARISRPSGAIPVSEKRPPLHTEVIGWIEDASVAIHDFPVVVWDSGTAEQPWYFTGVPGRYTALDNYGWTLTHWMPMTPN